jgi:hypothetical protein
MCVTSASVGCCLRQTWSTPEPILADSPPPLTSLPPPPGCCCAAGIHIVVATPGRLKDLLSKRRMNLDVCRCGRQQLRTEPK